MGVTVAFVVLGGLLLVVGLWLRGQGRGLYAVGACGVGAIVLLGGGLRALSGDDALDGASETPTASVAPGATIDVEAVTAACGAMPGPFGSASGRARFCRCVVQSIDVGRAADPSFTIGPDSDGELRLDSDADGAGIAAYQHAFGECVLPHVGHWYSDGCRRDCQGDGCSGFCRCMGREVAREQTPEQVQAFFWGPIVREMGGEVRFAGPAASLVGRENDARVACRESY